MAGVKLSPRLTMAMISLALLFNVLTLARAGESDDQANGELIFKCHFTWSKLSEEDRTPDEFFKGLRWLKQTFDQWGASVPQELEEMKTKVNQLFEESRVDGSLCTESKIAQLSSQTFSDREQPIQNYLLDSKAELLQSCASILVNKVKDATAYEQNSGLIKHLANEMSSDEFIFKNIEKHHEQLVESLKQELDKKSKLYKTPRKTLYQTLVIEPCRQWVKSSGTWRSAYKHLEKCYVADLLGETVRTPFICEYIQANDAKIQEDLKLDQEEIVEVVAKEEPVSEGRRATIAQRQDPTRWRKWML